VNLLRRLALVLAAVAIGLVLIEGAFRLRDHGAFPHLNVYRSDDQLGVRLRPDASERISFSHNPVSDVRINAQGYRGANWPVQEPGTIFVVGDSQAFGLGVNEDDAFAWKLAAALKRPLANGAVPTYGPAEYNAVLAEVLPRLKPKTVLYTINLANDLFEAAHANATRHAVWDGWAVRKETAPAQVASFPGREWLFRDSHAFFAARGLWFRLEGSGEEGRVASEGGWRDIVGSSAEVAKQRAEIAKAEQGERAQRVAAIADAVKERSEIEKAVYAAIEKVNGNGEEAGPSTLRAARANPGDIVRVDYGEGSEPVPVTMQQIAEAAAQRKNIEAKLRELHDDKSLGAILRQGELDDRVRALRAPIASALQRKSPLYAHLARAKQLCDENGAALVVVVLPVDVQVSAKEWDKYPGAQKLDLSQTRVLVDDVLDMADTLGARGVDAWPALAAAEPGAFLDGDLHMSPKGHAAVADAIARALAAPAKTKPPALPPGRSAVPTPEEWAAAKKPPSGQAYYTEYVPRGCTVKVIREWLRYSCKGAFVAKPGSAADALVINSPGYASLTLGMVEDQSYTVRLYGKEHGPMRFLWGVGEPTLDAFFSTDGQQTAKEAAAAAAHPPSAEELALCTCHQKTTGAADCRELYGAVEPGCTRAYGNDCAPLLACTRGDGSAPPQCLPNEQLTTPTHRCAPITPAPVAHAAK
jgi:ribosomal protein L25 (general stress protein Ctc)/lysophospholipase L1-like esterase